MKVFEIIFILYLFLSCHIFKNFEIHFILKYCIFLSILWYIIFFSSLSKPFVLDPKIFFFSLCPQWQDRSGDRTLSLHLLPVTHEINKVYYLDHMCSWNKRDLFQVRWVQFCYELWTSIFLTWLLRFTKGVFLSFPNKMQMAPLLKLQDSQSCVWVWISLSSRIRTNL